MRIVDKFLSSIANAQTEKSSKSNQTGGSASASPTESHRSVDGDSAEVSGLSYLLDQTLNAASGASVESLRSQYQQGRYQVDVTELSKVLARQILENR